MPVPDHRETAEEAASSAPSKKGVRLIWFGLAFLVLALVAPGIRLWRADSPAPPPSPVVQSAKGIDIPGSELSPDQVVQCEQMIREGQELGLIRRRPTPERIDVDTRMWAAMDRQTQRGLMLSLRCAAHGNGGSAVAAHDALNGERLAEASEAGVVFR